MPGAAGASPTLLEPLLSVEQAARLLGICGKGVRRQIYERQLPAVRVGSRVLIEPEAIRTYKSERATVSAA